MLLNPEKDIYVFYNIGKKSLARKSSYLSFLNKTIR
jgi:hypothetical protein